MSEEKYLLAKIKVLTSIISFCNKDTEIYRFYKNYKEDLKSTILEYENLDEYKRKSTISSLTYRNFIELVNRLTYIKNSNLQNLILDATLPIVFSDPEIKALGVKLNHFKKTFKDNSFHSDYYSITTPKGILELQSQSSDDYWRAKVGDAAHSDFKNFNIYDFFEYVHPEDEQEDLHTFLEKIDISKQSFKDTMNFSNDYDFKKKLCANCENVNKIKLKDSIKIFKNGYDKNKDNDNPDAYVVMNLNDFLLDFAISNCPTFIDFSCNSHNDNNNILVHKFTLVESFRELLRKKDSITYLGELLCKRLQKIMESKKGTPLYDSYMTTNLPNCITFDSIIDFYASMFPKNNFGKSHKDDDDAR